MAPTPTSSMQYLSESACFPLCSPSPCLRKPGNYKRCTTNSTLESQRTKNGYLKCWKRKSAFLRSEPRSIAQASKIVSIFRSRYCRPNDSSGNMHVSLLLEELESLRGHAATSGVG